MIHVECYFSVFNNGILRGCYIEFFMHGHHMIMCVRNAKTSNGKSNPFWFERFLYFSANEVADFTNMHGDIIFKIDKIVDMVLWDNHRMAGAYLAQI